MNTTSQQTTFRAARVIFSTIAVLFTVLWAAAYVTTDNPAALQRDWYCLWEAGVGFNKGRFNELYADRFQPGDHSGICREGYFWLYPPYALYPAAMLGSLPQTIAYPTVLLGVYGCYAIFLLALRRLFPTDPMSFQVFALGLLASAPLSSVVVTGQNSAWLLVGMSLGTAALKSKHWAIAGVCFAVFGLKPNWLPLVLLWLAIRGDWRVLATISSVGALMVLSSLPLGLSIWQDFQTSSIGYGNYVLANYPVDKLITIHAALRTSLGTSSNVITILWFFSLLLGIGTWWMTCRAERSIAAQAGIVVLVTVACNVYTNFYDSLLLALPAAVWWFEREHYESKIWRVIAVVIGSGWLWMWVHFFVSRGTTPGHLGGLLLVWMLFEGVQSYEISRRRLP